MNCDPRHLHNEESATRQISSNSHNTNPPLTARVGVIASKNVLITEIPASTCRHPFHQRLQSCRHGLHVAEQCRADLSSLRCVHVEHNGVLHNLGDYFALVNSCVNCEKKRREKWTQAVCSHHIIDSAVKIPIA